MKMRTRKLIGTVVLLVYLSVYAVVAAAVAMLLQVNASKLVEIAYYVVAGLAWVPPAMIVIWWMQKPDPA